MKDENWQEQILPLLPPQLRAIFTSLPAALAASLEEIRLRAGQPLMVQSGRGEVWLGLAGPVTALGESCRITAADLQHILLQMTEYSLYARDEELKRGYLALPGGHRAGFAGRVVMEGNQVKLLRDINALNIRIARQFKGAALKILPHVYCDKTQRVRHTLLVSAPQAGKTTMLRDLARLLANGDQQKGRPGFKVGIVDERSELAGCFRGEPQLDVGVRSDILDGCTKAEGMMMLVRSMSPQVIVTDELGRAEDARAVEEAVNTGASILATAHGQNARELIRRPSLAYLLENGLFERVIVLSRRHGPGTVEDIYTGHSLQEWLRAGRECNVD
ncbi:MAG TPA: stage III sporulation protein AA [Oscillospiraceae bacterium]|nr:stage III sporulation protein AA [Oscillospiraceae bacterium]